MLQQGLHAGAKVLLQDGLHGCSPPAQAEVEVSEPEDLVEAGGDVRWGMRGREVWDPPPLPVCLLPDNGSGHSRTPPEVGGSPGPPWGSGPGRHRGGGVPAAFLGSRGHNSGSLVPDLSSGW